MKIKDGITPIYLKLEEDFTWPTDTMFYLLTVDGMFLCRNHPFFKSCVKATKLPPGMPAQYERLTLAYPRISPEQMGMVVGWFAEAAKKSCEAIVLLCWNALDKRLELVCPKQTASNWMDLKYDVPSLPPGWSIIGDIHSHVNMSAYTSNIDEKDEVHRPGLHIVVGKIEDEPPEFHIEATVDGRRFTVKDQDAIFDYEARRKDFPLEWRKQITTKYHKPFERTGKWWNWNKTNNESNKYNEWLETRAAGEYFD